ncbi:MAG: hypothetical protein LBT13_09210 [Treponema sp.]|jgi:hypothetical protein|nr:hypothetical protein [Treponema sp.]
MREQTTEDKILRAAAVVSVTVAVLELACAQLHIRLTRLSAVETTGISLFGFIIFGLVTLFAVMRMMESIGGKIFAVLMNIIAALFATWYLNLLFHDNLFFQNLYYSQNLLSGGYDLLPLARRISATIPLGLIIVGAACYYLSALTIVVVMCITRRSLHEA